MNDIANPRLLTNNFDLLRLVLASIVCFVHAYQLSGFIELRWVYEFFSAKVAVKAFFVVSGFLIFMSYERSSSVKSYFKKRIKRIYPAYFAIVCLCAFGFVFISSLSVSDYFSSSTWWKYLLANLSFVNFIQPSLPGVFDTNAQHFVNGALWTIKIEMMFYFSVPVFVFLFRKFSRLPLIIFTYLASFLYVWLMHYMADKTGASFYDKLAIQLPGQLSYFFAGAFLYYYLPFFEKHVKYFLLAAAVILIGDNFVSLALLEPFAIAVIVIFCALFCYLGNAGKYGDFSYGVYIVHFPLIQLLIYSQLFQGQPYLFLITAVFLTIIGGVMMWHLVEKRFLARKSHYIQATKEKGS